MHGKSENTDGKTDILNNSFQLPCVSDCILDDRGACESNSLFWALSALDRLDCACGTGHQGNGIGLSREVYVAIFDSPAALLCELDDGTLGLEE